MPHLKPLLTALLACFAWALMATEEPALEAFLTRLKPLGQSRTLLAQYTQTRHISDLDFDLVVKGSFAQEQDKRLAWLTETPLKTVCLFTPDSFRMWDAESGRTNTLNAAKYPWIRMIFEMQSAWMSGNAAALKRNFSLRLVDSRTLEMTPTAQGGASLFFTRIVLVMAADFLSVQKVVFTEKTGDTITLVFTQVQRNVPIPEATWRLP